MSTQPLKRAEREALGLTQQEAAARANVSLASWRRWESDPVSVSEQIAHACEQVLTTREFDMSIAAAWTTNGHITPRQAAAIIYVLSSWADVDLGEWLTERREPLHDVGPFWLFDRRVMMLVADNAAFAASAQDRCRLVAEEIEQGTLPFARPGCYFDEVLIGAASRAAQDLLADMSDLVEGIPARTGTEIENVDLDELDWDTYQSGDDDWDSTTDYFDDEANWGDWEVPVIIGHPFIPDLLIRRHPFRWFDTTEPEDVLLEVRASELTHDDLGPPELRSV